MELCISCENECGGAHSCKVCKKPCHAIEPCSFKIESNREDCGSDDDEGYGAVVTCRKCSKKEKPKPPKKKHEALQSFLNQFKKRSSKDEPKVPPKRMKAGHENTQMAICLVCYKEKKSKFWLSRFNKSTVQQHSSSTHKDQCNVEKEIVPANALAAKDAMFRYQMLMESKQSAKSKESINDETELKVIESIKDSGSSSASPSSCKTKEKNNVETELKDIESIKDSESSSPPPSQCKSEENINSNTELKVIESIKDFESSSASPSQWSDITTVKESCTDASGRGIAFQQSMDVFLSHSSSENENILLTESTTDQIALNIASKVAKILNKKGFKAENTPAAKETANDISNLSEFIEQFSDFCIFEDEGTFILRCCACSDYINSPFDKRPPQRKASTAKGSIALGLTLDSYPEVLAGHCLKWYDLKHKLMQHVSSDTHGLALQHKKAIADGEKRRIFVVKNQLRTALGVVKSKSAALHYETRIAELHAAGADIGDYGHSRKLFNLMVKTACVYIDKKVKAFFQTPLPSTGLPPHCYVSADKSTNHRISNQVTMVCPVINGERKGIPLSMTPVYFTSDGDTGRGKDLAEAIINALSRHAGIDGQGLLQVQGKVTDGQYLNSPFESSINEPFMKVLRSFEEELLVDLSVVQDLYWWPLQWDPGHWLDKVFSSLKEKPFLDRLLKRTSIYHQTFRHGKMHSIAKETAKELCLPFRVTNAFAHQRFMSSSYLSLKNLANSLEAYIETFKDHDNTPEVGYKLYGQDFVFDLMAVLDLLWPLVLLMLEGQAQWCPGWKFVRYIEKSRKEIQKVINEISSADPSKQVCKYLGAHLHEIKGFKYGQSDLEIGWLVVKEEKGYPIDWKAREISDCIQEVKDLGENVIKNLDDRFKNCFPELNRALSCCLDFGMLFAGLCGRRSGKSLPVSKSAYSKLGLKEFTECCKFVASLPHICNQNLELGEEFSFTVFWKFKSALIEVVWGEMFQSHFHKFFGKVSTSDSGNVKVVELEKERFIEEGFKVVEFSESVPSEFTLSEVFHVKLSNGKSLEVVLKEECLIKALYMDVEFYTTVGQEFCLVFDIMYAKTGTEAVVESFYRVVEQQEMHGGQSLEILGARAKVDWCFPPTVQCDNALTEMAKMYLHGDKESGLPKHNVPVYKNFKSKKHALSISKVVDRIKSTEPRLPFLL